MRELFKQCGFTDVRSVLDYSKGLALTDTLWVTDNSDLDWNVVNLFDNLFDEVIAQVAFEGGLANRNFSTTSPEFSTDGALAKCWIRDDSGIKLVKAGTTGFSNTGYEPLCEVLAHQVLDRLEYGHVSYGVSKYRGRRVSVCPLMTSKDLMLLPVYRYYSNFQSIESILDNCIQDGLIADLFRMLVFDYLSVNTDRHAGNFGVLLDSDTFALRGFAPLWDHGCSMLCYWNGEQNLEEYASSLMPALYDSFEWGAKLGKEFLGSRHNVQKLIGFEFDLTQVGDYPVSRILKIQDWLQARVRRFLSL